LKQANSKYKYRNKYRLVQQKKDRGQIGRELERQKNREIDRQKVGKIKPTEIRKDRKTFRLR
jgi:hypothetical protein